MNRISPTFGQPKPVALRRFTGSGIPELLAFVYSYALRMSKPTSFVEVLGQKHPWTSWLHGSLPTVIAQPAEAGSISGLTGCNPSLIVRRLPINLN